MFLLEFFGRYGSDINDSRLEGLSTPPGTFALERVLLHVLRSSLLSTLTLGLAVM